MSEERKRTKDVIIDEDIDFTHLQISEEIMKGLNDAGYKKPSPIQLKAIPLGKSGADIIAQSKSGTGKTIVFGVVALEKVVISDLVPQVLILSPTREIAQQSQHVIRKIGKYINGLRCETFIGGIPIARDIDRLSPCHIVVGTPGRVKQLIEEGWLRVDTIKLFILDEVDKIMGEPSQYDTTIWIMDVLNTEKQFMAFSATYTDKITEILKKTMKNPQFILLDKDKPSLEGVKQFYWCVDENSTMMESIQKTNKVVEILSNLSFHQCLIFCNNRGIARSLSSLLNRKGWPSMVISSHLSQKERNKAIKKLRSFNIRVLISSDLISRGIDIERVNLVINMDIPRDRESYMHRIGRTGRFGTYGVAITFVNKKELSTLKSIVEYYHSEINPLPDNIPESYYAYELTDEEEKKALERLENIRKEANEKEDEEDDEENGNNNNYMNEYGYDWSSYQYNYPNYYNYYYGQYYNPPMYHNYYSTGDFNHNYILSLQMNYISQLSKHIESYCKKNKKKMKKRKREDD